MTSVTALDQLRGSFGQQLRLDVEMTAPKISVFVCGSGQQ
jgi:hypothetical protein